MFSPRHGQGLLELIIAISIIITALISIVSLTIMSVSGQKVSENETIAANLSRDGIEVIRNLRDSSFLEGKMIGVDYISGFNNHVGRVSYDTLLSGLQANFDAITDNADVNVVFNDADTILNRDATTGYYHHSGTAATIFRRAIFIDFICQNSSGCTDGICSTGEASCPDVATDSDTTADVIGYRITSHVRWNEKGVTKNYILADYLYQWK